MSVSKDEKTGKWLCSIWYRDWQGERKHTTKRGFERKKDAEQYERDFLSKKQRQNPTMQAVIEEYIVEMESLVKLGQIKPSTKQTKLTIINNAIIPYFAKLKVENVAPADVNKWLSHISTHSVVKEQLSSGYLNAARSVLSQLFKFSAQNYLTENNPVERTKRIKKYSTDKRAKLWTLEQYQQFYATIKKQSYRVLFNIIFWGGLRISEALALSPADIQPFFINVSKSLIKLNTGETFISTPKNLSSIRRVEIPKYLYNQISDFIAGQYGLSQSDLIFDGLSSATVRSYLDYNTTKLGLPKISPHILRHSYASLLYASSKNILIVANQLGHADTNTTLKVYAHMLPDANRDAIDALELMSIDCKQKSK